ncbi:hypothetical protein Pla108_33980 [Botrimarina colliarenosi]|uniref:Uncharacterized protein n=1 Tax=Botrimarina colliarenosi TaxID=2528001 RepID=A0A5C6A5N4_9BACT|nr:hypothetical protein [Botrimarina colliarenosi]TWT95254.1 hypothetical protein Pla108_33980 [Botrimarina colliarenosi]
MSFRHLRMALVGSVALGVCACGPGHDYEMAPVRGAVTVDGQPLSGGRLMFAPVSGGGVKAGKPGFADVGADGTYVVSTYGSNDGAVVANHWVTILSTGSDAAKQQLRGASRVQFPRQQTVAAGQENVIDIALTTDDIRRFGEGAD